MNEKNKIYELTRLINNTSPLNEDVLNAMDVIRTNFQNNYVKKLVHAAGSEESDAQQHPSREVVLLNALKGFSGKTSHSSINHTIEMLTTLQAISNIHSTLDTISQNQTSIQMKSSGSAGENTEVLSKNSLNLTNILLTLELIKKL